MKVGIRVFPKDVMEFATSKRQFFPPPPLNIIYGKKESFSYSIEMTEKIAYDLNL